MLPHVIKYLKVGETYTLHEEFAPHGYLVANNVTSQSKNTGEVQKVEMKDEVPVGELIINKKRKNSWILLHWPIRSKVWWNTFSTM